MKTAFRSVVLGLAMIVSSVALAPAATAQTPKPTFPVGALWYTVNVAEPGHDHERVFYIASLPAVLPKELSAALSALPPFRPANAIADKSGREIGRYSPPVGHNVADFRKQAYRGKPVRTWWQGAEKGGYGSGMGCIAGENYHVIKTVSPGDGLTADEHEPGSSVTRTTPSHWAQGWSSRSSTTPKPSLRTPSGCSATTP